MVVFPKSYPSALHSQQLTDFIKQWIEVHPDVLQQIIETLELDYDHGEFTGNVCFINNPQIREDYKNAFSTEDLFHYSYATMHASHLRSKYGDFCWSNTALIPTPPNKDSFWKLVAIGEKLNELHIMEVMDDFKIGKPITNDTLQKTAHPIPNEFHVLVESSPTIIEINDWTLNFSIGPYHPIRSVMSTAPAPSFSKIEFKELMLTIRKIRNSQSLLAQIDGVLETFDQ